MYFRQSYAKIYELVPLIYQIYVDNKGSDRLEILYRTILLSSGNLQKTAKSNQ